MLIRTDDTGHAWTLRISDGPIVATPGGTERPEAVFAGTAVQLYLSLWNRADEITGPRVLPAPPVLRVAEAECLPWIQATVLSPSCCWIGEHPAEPCHA